ncbi:GNAT family N-acetyltransferase [Paraburkholderia saeva]|uniref:Acetyltransferase n=1 Tax=Paraburkholderia saeva TaxID=2777537 RepID=A0A9N8X0B4_9BURK|nr:GNAT family N-acetyltransferase [Paraburkholderia saeva]CAG4886118.1 Acetyltransferase [Paraburkholderia saeva]CAG4887476.1 Acetyltransferase [Paraburkholderia saeva]CAG4901569.1 Acetyltransferase [Paraburkholderia saeva]
MQLRTARLALRAWRDDDLTSLVSMNADPEVNVWLGGPALVRNSEAAFNLMRERLAAHGWGVLVVEDQAGTFLGICGLQPVRASLPIAPATEIIWRFRREAWGHGYASEAAIAVLDASSQHGVPEEIVALVAWPNQRSASTAQRIGFRHDPSRDFLYPDLDANHPLRAHRVFARGHF